MIVQTIIFAVLLLIMWTIVILLVWHDAKQPKIVRCRDCKYYETALCAMESLEEYPWHPTNDADFCSYGERKTNDDGTR